MLKSLALSISNSYKQNFNFNWHVRLDYIFSSDIVQSVYFVTWIIPVSSMSLWLLMCADGLTLVFCKA